MIRIVVRLVALAVAVTVAIAAGVAVRHQMTPSDPVDVAEDATRAYATGDCAALREVSLDPVGVDCAAVADVRDAYRREGLEVETFQYDVVRSDAHAASVRITYRRDGRTAEEIVELQRPDDDWKVLPVPSGG
jgi:hypothetical protein